MSSSEEFPPRTGCYHYDPMYEPSYHYRPSLGAGVAFDVLFGITIILHIAQSSYKRSWWYMVFAVGSITEVIGWAARTWSSQCPYNHDAFLMQISTLIIAPTFYTAGIYVILGKLIEVLGRQYGLMRPKLYLIIFCVCDFISLVVQAIGGGMASAAAQGKEAPGTHTMVAGIVFQLFTISIFVLLFIHFMFRVRHVHLDKKIKYLVGATAFSITVIYIRSIYRVVELSEGWNGYLISHERYFIALDAVMMVLAVGVYNIFHPAFLLPSGSETAGKEMDFVKSVKPTPNP